MWLGRDAQAQLARTGEDARATCGLDSRVQAVASASRRRSTDRTARATVWLGQDCPSRSVGVSPTKHGQDCPCY
ncbi:MAG: hypothetical protein NZ556_01860 [Fimbriimonadales bacterium]|nr:hypothetical protein [Fimbriimonadales bacterium]